MPFYPVRDDITRMKVDAIVNAANRSLLGGGGVDGAIHSAAGPELLEECRKLGGCRTGEAKLTRGYRLPAKYVIHTVGPIYEDGAHGEEALLRSCYRHSLELAERHGLESVAFPLISAGAYGYPPEAAVRVAGEEIAAFLRHSDMTVYLVFYGKDAYTAGRSRYPEIESRIEESRIRERRGTRWDSRKEDRNSIAYSLGTGLTGSARFSTGLECDEERPTAEQLAKAKSVYARRAIPADVGSAAPPSLEDALKNRDESFSEMLLRCISASGMTDPECYRRANIDKKLFSKIRSKSDYRPSKPTVLAFAVALRLDSRQTGLLLRRAGFALNGSDPFDIIVDYYISRGEYDLYKINDTLFSYDQPLLGNCAR